MKPGNYISLAHLWQSKRHTIQAHALSGGAWPRGRFCFTATGADFKGIFLSTRSAWSRYPAVIQKGVLIRIRKDFENVVVSAHLDFKFPARFEDPLLIEVRVREIKRSGFTFDFRIRHKSENRVVAEGYTTHCAVDENFRPMNVPDFFRETIAAFEG